MIFGRRLRWPLLLIPAALLLVWLTAALWPHQVRALSHGDQSHPPLLIQAEELKTLIARKEADLRIIDVRHQAKYYLGHIPGAIQIWRPQLEDRRQLLPARQLEKILGRLGVGSDQTLVIYSDRCDHTRLWWLLAHYGFPPGRMRLLDGGIDAWKSKGYATQFTAPHVGTATFHFPAPPRTNYLLANLEEVKAALGQPGKVILDVREPRLYRGEGSKEGAARPGRIPGALGIFWEDNLVASGPAKGCWKSPAEIRELYTSRGITPDQDIYLYGHNDRCAAFTLVSLRLAGFPLEKLHLYAGSWIEWSRSPEPVQTGP